MRMDKEPGRTERAEKRSGQEKRTENGSGRERGKERRNVQERGKEERRIQERREEGRSIQESSGKEKRGERERGKTQEGWKTWEQARSLSPAPAQKEQALSAIRQEIAKKKIRRSPAWWESVLVELQYITPLFWLAQGGFVILLFVFLERTHLREGVLSDYLQWASIAAAWLGVFLYGSMGRHFSRGMAELEQSCYFNLSQMWAIKMALVGTADILILALGCGRISGFTRAPFLQVMVYLLVPYVLSNVCCLLFFSALRGGKGYFGNLVRAFPAVLVAVVPASIPQIYEAAFWWIWLLALSISTALFAWQIWLVYRKMERGEVLCWN